jgi:starch phosphorylase
MTAQTRYALPAMPAEIAGLVDLALDLRWSWSHSSDVIWQWLDKALWDTTHNPWHILQTVSQTRLTEAAADPEFVMALDQHVAARRSSLEAMSWFEKTYPEAASAEASAGRLGPVAYFCMEFGLSEALPIYSGGLGILAGDFLKTASDLGVPVIGVGLLWQQGYFRQTLSSAGEQMEVFPFNDPGQLPITPLRDADGEWVSVSIRLPRRQVLLRAWQVRAGRVKLYLLDSNDMLNTPVDRGITGYLYGGGPEMRLQQEMALGIGGWRLFEELGISPDVCHLNEGHAAFAILERAHTYMRTHGVGFSEALTATRAGNVFTTHTPVEAGFDRFSSALVGEYLGSYADELGIGIEELLSLGRPAEDRDVDDGRPFNMAFLALRGSGAVNGVSRLHGEVSRKLFQPLFPRWPLAEIPVGHVTNGVHVPSWDSREADRLWTQACGKERWLGDPYGVSDAMRSLSDEELWTFRQVSRRTLIAMARDHVERQGPIAGSLESLGADPSCLCDPTVFTLGFARRFATYKRANLLLHDPDRLQRLLCGSDSRMQLIIAGKAHPADGAGKAMIQQWTEFIKQCTVRPHVVFLVDYDMGIAEHLVHGVDLWINTPRRPWEACGTSGMKVLVNGGLNLSELDGWWAEAYAPDIGWALGDGLEHDSDPGWDACEADQLYELLEKQIVPEFYDRDEQGIPRRWMARVRESMARLVPEFSSNRMIKDYLERYYLPAAAANRERTRPPAGARPRGGPLQPSPADLVAGIDSWRTLLDRHWCDIRFLDYALSETDGPAGKTYDARVRLDLGSVPPAAILVQLYAESPDGGPPERHILMTDLGAMRKGHNETSGDDGGTPYTFRVVFPARRPPNDYTPRVIPSHRFARVPLESGHILWYR